MADRASVPSDWERHLSSCIPLFGHRNWIVVADAAYPAQSNPHIETIAADAEQMDAVRTVRNAISGSRHVRANIYVDAELDFVAETDAPGIADYRKELEGVLYGAAAQRMPHEQIIAKLDQSAQLFHILIIKTDMTIPYTSVFFELDCGYWSVEAEERLREAMKAVKAK